MGPIVGLIVIPAFLTAAAMWRLHHPIRGIPDHQSVTMMVAGLAMAFGSWMACLVAFMRGTFS